MKLLIPVIQNLQATASSFKSKISIDNKDFVMPFSIGAICFWFIFGIDKLFPDNIGWLMRGDWAPVYFGWEFFRQADWTFPLGNTPNLFYPHGSNLAYTDSNPLFSIFSKLFFNWILPEHHAQLFGYWLLICWILQAIFANKILIELKVNNFIYRAFAVSIIVISPVLLIRTGHITLCGQWIILMAIWNYIREAEVKRLLFTQLLILFLASSINPYFLLVVACFSVALVVKHAVYTKQLNLYEYLHLIILQPVLVLGVWYSLGYFQLSVSNSSEEFIYGQFAANLNAFFNPLDASSFFNSLKTYHMHPYEGLGYLGLGGLLMLFVLFLYRRNQLFESFYSKNKNFPLLVTAILLFLFALSNRIVFGGEVVLEIKNLGIMDSLVGMFGYSARFIWTAHYLILFLVIVQSYRLFKDKNYAVIFIGVICVVQVADLKPLIHQRKEEMNVPNRLYSILNEDSLEYLAKTSSKIVTYPPFQRDLIKTDDYIDFAYLAVKANVPITTGYLASVNRPFVEEYKNKILPDSIRQTNLSDALYITSDKYMFDFMPALLTGKAIWKKIGDYNYIFPSSNENAKNFLRVSGKYEKFDKIHTFLTKYNDKTIIASVRDEATSNLSEEAKVYLRTKGSRIDQLAFRGSYLLLINNGTILHEEINNEHAVSLNFHQGFNLNGFVFPKAVEIHSAGSQVGDYSKIIIEGQEFSKNQRGVNLVALDSDFNVIESVNVDTHASSDWIRPVVQ